MSFETGNTKCYCEESAKRGEEIAKRVLHPGKYKDKLISGTEFEYLSKTQKILFVFSRFQARGLMRELISYKHNAKGYMSPDGETEVWYAYLEKIITVYRLIFERVQNKPRDKKYFTETADLCYEFELLTLDPVYVVCARVDHIFDIIERRC